MSCFTRVHATLLLVPLLVPLLLVPPPLLPLPLLLRWVMNEFYGYT